MNARISSDGAACVDPDYFWQPISTAPHGVKVQALSKYGVAAYSVITQQELKRGFWTHWAPVPKLKRETT